MNYDDSLGNDADDDALPGGDMRRELHESADRERLLELELENAGLRRQLAGNSPGPDMARIDRLTALA